MKFWVGVYLSTEVGKTSKRETFAFEDTPTVETHGKYDLVLGPFNSKWAAGYMAGPGYCDPCCITPNDAERKARQRMELVEMHGPGCGCRDCSEVLMMMQ